jgi:hypothetical protein
VIDASRLSNFHLELVKRLQHETGVALSIIEGRSRRAVPASIDLLLDLERMLLRVHGGKLSERLDREQLPALKGDDGQFDLVIDFCGEARAGRGRTVRVLYDGMAGEAFLLGALLSGRMPVIEIVDAPSGHVVSRGVACADNARTIVEALDCVLARVGDLVVSAVRGWESVAEARDVTATSCRLRDLVRFEAASLGHTVSRYLYRLCCYSPHWRTLWRFVEGPDLWETRTLAGSSWNVIPDPGFSFYADPFPFEHRGCMWLFVEDFDHRSQKGVISVVPFDKRGPSGPAQRVLEEPWHLSYPFVFEHEGEVWMIPESSAERRVSLYRATSFPLRWTREAVLLEDIDASDATLVHHGGCYWLFAATRAGSGSCSDRLSIFSAPKPLGPWTPHEGNGVLVDQTAARPAGAFVRRGGRLWRPVQDCAAGYGTGIGLVEVLCLDRRCYEQKLHVVLRAAADWPGRRLHTLNRAGRLEVIDGAAHSPRSRSLARRLQPWSGRREQPFPGEGQVKPKS